MNNPFNKENREEKEMRKLARSFDPSRQVTKNAKATFMATVHEELGLAPVRSYIWVRYAVMVVVVLVALNGAAVIYADTTDVPVTHPLYAYKRVGENIEVAVATPSKKVEIQAKIAERRTNELNALIAIDATASSTATSTNATSTEDSHDKNESLKKQLRDEIKAEVKSVRESLKKLSTTTAASKKNIVCSSLGQIKKNSALKLNDDQVDLDINDICEQKIDHNEDATTTKSQNENEVEVEHSQKIEKRNKHSETEIKTNSDTRIESEQEKDRDNESSDDSGENRVEILNNVNSKIGL